MDSSVCKGKFQNDTEYFRQDFAYRMLIRLALVVNLLSDIIWASL